jgi:hypothetical protein
MVNRDPSLLLDAFRNPEAIIAGGALATMALVSGCQPEGGSAPTNNGNASCNRTEVYAAGLTIGEAPDLGLLFDAGRVASASYDLGEKGPGTYDYTLEQRRVIAGPKAADGTTFNVSHPGKYYGGAIVRLVSGQQLMCGMSSATATAR